MGIHTTKKIHGDTMANVIVAPAVVSKRGSMNVQDDAFGLPNKGTSIS